MSVSISLAITFSFQGPPGLKGEQGDTVVIDYDGRILEALKVTCMIQYDHTIL